jgi:hypothetical protein
MQGVGSDAVDDEGDDELDGTLGSCVLEDAQKEEIYVYGRNSER